MEYIGFIQIHYIILYIIAHRLYYIDLYRFIYTDRFIYTNRYIILYRFIYTDRYIIAIIALYNTTMFSYLLCINTDRYITLYIFLYNIMCSIQSINIPIYKYNYIMQYYIYLDVLVYIYYELYIQVGELWWFIAYIYIHPLVI